MPATTKKNSRVIGAARRELIKSVAQRYQNGMSVRDLAAAEGRSYGFIYRLLVEGGISMRKRGGNMRGKSTPTT